MLLEHRRKLDILTRAGEREQAKHANRKILMALHRLRALLLLNVYVESVDEGGDLRGVLPPGLREQVDQYISSNDGDVGVVKFLGDKLDQTPANQLKKYVTLVLAPLQSDKPPMPSHPDSSPAPGTPQPDEPPAPPRPDTSPAPDPSSSTSPIPPDVSSFFDLLEGLQEEADSDLLVGTVVVGAAIFGVAFFFIHARAKEKNVNELLQEYEALAEQHHDLKEVIKTLRSAIEEEEQSDDLFTAERIHTHRMFGGPINEDTWTAIKKTYLRGTSLIFLNTLGRDVAVASGDGTVSPYRKVIKTSASSLEIVASATLVNGQESSVDLKYNQGFMYRGDTYRRDLTMTNPFRIELITDPEANGRKNREQVDLFIQNLPKTLEEAVPQLGSFDRFKRLLPTPPSP